MYRKGDMLDLGSMTFYWTVASSFAGEFPSQLPFRFESPTADPSLIRQARTSELDEVLGRIYEADSNVGYIQADNSLGKPYELDLFRQIQEVLERVDDAGTRVLKILEIGCGGCLVLAKLADLGHSVTGVDPSPIAATAAKAMGLSVVCDYFSNVEGLNEFDLVYHADVLEHMENPVEFLKECRSSLKEGGWVLVSVPDCTESIDLGDVSMALHQHLSYFTTRSLRETLVRSGFSDVEVVRARYGGSLYGFGRYLGLSSSAGLDQDTDEGARNSEFLVKAERNLSRVQKLIMSYLDSGHSVGGYVPLRLFPFLGSDRLLEEHRSQLRLFDDTPHWRGRKFQPNTSPIENFGDLVNRPPDLLLIMSLTFGEQLATKVRANDGMSRSGVEIVTLRDLLA